jgi:hypothetical protein
MDGPSDRKRRAAPAARSRSVNPRSTGLADGVLSAGEVGGLESAGLESFSRVELTFSRLRREILRERWFPASGSSRSS